MSIIRVFFNYLTSSWGNFIPPAVKKYNYNYNYKFNIYADKICNKI